MLVSSLLSMIRLSFSRGRAGPGNDTAVDRSWPSMPTSAAPDRPGCSTTPTLLTSPASRQRLHGRDLKRPPR
jgi:hypothetical protein